HRGNDAALARRGVTGDRAGGGGSAEPLHAARSRHPRGVRGARAAGRPARASAAPRRGRAAVASTRSMSDLAEEYESSGYGHVADALILEKAPKSESNTAFPAPPTVIGTLRANVRKRPPICRRPLTSGKST